MRASKVSRSPSLQMMTTKSCAYCSPPSLLLIYAIIPCFSPLSSASWTWFRAPRTLFSLLLPFSSFYISPPSNFIYVRDADVRGLSCLLVVSAGMILSRVSLSQSSHIIDFIDEAFGFSCYFDIHADVFILFPLGFPLLRGLSS